MHPGRIEDASHVEAFWATHGRTFRQHIRKCVGMRIDFNDSDSITILAYRFDSLSILLSNHFGQDKKVYKWVYLHTFSFI